MSKDTDSPFGNIVRDRNRRQRQDDASHNLTTSEHRLVSGFGPVIMRILEDVGKAEWGRGLLLKHFEIIVPKQSLCRNKKGDNGVRELIWVLRSMRRHKRANTQSSLFREHEEYSIAIRLDDAQQAIGFTVAGADSIDTTDIEESSLTEAVRQVLTGGPDVVPL